MNLQVIDLSNSLWMDSLEKLRHDIYHLPKYVSLEASRTKTVPEAVLIVDGEKIFFAPYLLRQCDDISDRSNTTSEANDVVSPYGYPGILLSEAAINASGFPDYAMNELKQVLKSKGVCSAFFRFHPILNHNFVEIFQPDTFVLEGQTVTIDLRLPEPEIWSSTKSSRRKQINECKRVGLTARMVPFKDHIDKFTEIYKETMARVGANNVYFSFDRDYFTQLENVLGDKVHLCIVELEDRVACAGIYTECCGIVQSVLGGTMDDFVDLSPRSLEMDYARFWAKERGNEFLHLGGGVGATIDKVYSFKASFSKLRHTYLTQRLIIDEEKYNHLVNLRAEHLNIQAPELLGSNFFPAYRSSN